MFDLQMGGRARLGLVVLTGLFLAGLLLRSTSRTTHMARAAPRPAPTSPRVPPVAEPQPASEPRAAQTTPTQEAQQAFAEALGGGVIRCAIPAEHRGAAVRLWALKRPVLEDGVLSAVVRMPEAELTIDHTPGGVVELRWTGATDGAVVPCWLSVVDAVPVRGRVWMGDEPAAHAKVYGLGECKSGQADQDGFFELHLAAESTCTLRAMLDGATSRPFLVSVDQAPIDDIELVLTLQAAASPERRIDDMLDVEALVMAPPNHLQRDELESALSRPDLSEAAREVLKAWRDRQLADWKRSQQKMLDWVDDEIEAAEDELDASAE